VARDPSDKKGSVWRGDCCKPAIHAALHCSCWCRGIQARQTDPFLSEGLARLDASAPAGAVESCVNSRFATIPRVVNSLGPFFSPRHQWTISRWPSLPISTNHDPIECGVRRSPTSLVVGTSVYWYLFAEKVLRLGEGNHIQVMKENPEVDTRPYNERHFPVPRPPVPAAPYVGGVEWDATN
jgi:hypothetical protein